MKTVGNTYQRPAWSGLVGLIVAGVVTQENKTNLTNAQLQFMKICLEGKNWTVEFKGEAKAQLEPTGGGSGSPTALPADHPAPTASAPVPSSNASGATTAKSIPGESRYMFEAERLAKSTGCAAPVAAMNFKGAGAELFTVTCSTGDLLSIRCDDGTACHVDPNVGDPD
jgi:hypothetical protein